MGTTSAWEGFGVQIGAEIFPHVIFARPGPDLRCLAGVLICRAPVSKLWGCRKFPLPQVPPPKCSPSLYPSPPPLQSPPLCNPPP